MRIWIVIAMRKRGGRDDLEEENSTRDIAELCP